MNSYVKTAMMAFCLVLGGCGLTNPYEKWLDEGVKGEDRLLPSGFKAVLCDVGTWKVDCEGTDVYFQFGKDWSVNSDSELEKLATNSTYNIMSESADALRLMILGAGHLSYLLEDADEAYTVKEYSSASFTATGKDSGRVLTFEPAPEDALAKIAAEKEALLVTLRACQEFIAAGYKTAAVHNSDGDFVCRFAINQQEGHIKFDVIADGVLTHNNVDVAVDEDGNLDFKTSITLDGKNPTGIVLTNGDVAFKGVSDMNIVSNAESRHYFLADGYPIHAISFRYGRGDAVQYIIDEITPHDEWGDIEFNERETRPLVFCPDNDKERYWYTFFDSFKEEDGANVSSEYNDIIYMSKSDGYMPYGGWEDENGKEINNAPEILNTLPKFMNGYFHKDGLIMVHDYGVEDDENHSYLWLISPTTDFWVKARD
ncbi:MAG: hypothetical protein LIR35_05015 [Bacteroidota bacterium]|nr:hypothetical protein [Bacteroidota bacterium]